MTGNKKVNDEPTLIKVMKDGSKRYGSRECPKCAGSGVVWSTLDNGKCWQCDGTGVYYHEWTVPSEERKEKHAAKNKAKLIAQADKHNKDFFDTNGFNDEGKTYVVLGNTYDIKDELKSMGGKYNPTLGWHIPNDTDKYETIELSVDEICQYDENGWVGFVYDVWDIVDEKKKEHEAAKKADNPDAISEYVGEVGQKITVDVKVIKKTGYDSKFGWTNVYKFADDDGNIFVWQTSSGLDKSKGDEYIPVQEGEDIRIMGTIKDHKEYKGEKETVLTRVKLN